jgi:predicted nucleotidyltransferase
MRSNKAAASVVSYGSSASGFAAQGSDVDLCVRVPLKRRRSEARTFIERVASFLKKREPFKSMYF